MTGLLDAVEDANIESMIGAARLQARRAATAHAQAVDKVVALSRRKAALQGLRDPDNSPKLNEVLDERDRIARAMMRLAVQDMLAARKERNNRSRVLGVLLTHQLDVQLKTKETHDDDNQPDPDDGAPCAAATHAVAS